jgi:hypothetical protein
MGHRKAVNAQEHSAADAADNLPPPHVTHCSTSVISGGK